MRIAFIHPDLGIGCAERMVVDAAACLQAAGHRVTIFTAQHDQQRCFEFSQRIFGARLEAILGDVIERRTAERPRC